MGLVSGVSRPMRIHHATALALVGWYLMVQGTEPMSQWKTIFVTDSGKACQQLLWKIHKDAAADLKQHFNSDVDVESIKRAMQRATSPSQLDKIGHDVDDLATVCIATDDPRLKEK